MITSTWIALHDLCVIWMTAVIWMVQIFLYPDFQEVPENGFVAHHRRHCQRIAVLVAPLFIQAIAAGAVLSNGAPSFEWVFQGLSISLILLSTATLFAPLHRRLEAGKDPVLIRRLIRWNWGRTLLWTFQLGVIIARTGLKST
jgi:hypothetical protein